MEMTRWSFGQRRAGNSRWSNPSLVPRNRDSNGNLNGLPNPWSFALELFQVSV